MREKIEKILKDQIELIGTLKSYDVKYFARNIVEVVQEELEIDFNAKIENEKLKAQVEMKDNLIKMYENIIAKSNFNVILKGKDK